MSKLDKIKRIVLGVLIIGVMFLFACPSKSPFFGTKSDGNIIQDTTSQDSTFLNSIDTL